MLLIRPFRGVLSLSWSSDAWPITFIGFSNGFCNSHYFYLNGGIFFIIVLLQCKICIVDNSWSHTDIIRYFGTRHSLYVLHYLLVRTPTAIITAGHFLNNLVFRFQINNLLSQNRYLLITNHSELKIFGGHS